MPQVLLPVLSYILTNSNPISASKSVLACITVKIIDFGSLT